MRATPSSASLATALAAVALLSACGGGGGGTEQAGPPASGSPTVSPTVTPPATKSATPAPSPPLSRPPERASSSAPAPSVPASSLPASSTPTGRSGATVHTYQDLTLTLPVAEDAIAHAPPGLTAYVRQILTKQWDRYHHTAACERAPQVEVLGARSDGFAYVYRAADPSVENCPDAMADAGGYRAVLKDVDGAWRQIMSFQDVPACGAFEKWDVPSAILVPDDKCTKGDAIVTYVHG